MRKRKLKDLKAKKILIRINNADKELAERLSSLAGMNTSEFFRSRLHDCEREPIITRLEVLVAKLETLIKPRA